jgi:hypothetical protein
MFLVTHNIVAISESPQLSVNARNNSTERGWFINYSLNSMIKKNTSKKTLNDIKKS